MRYGFYLGIFAAVLVAANILFLPAGVEAERGTDDHFPRPEISLDLGENFFQALRENSGSKQMGTGVSEEYLRQIAIAGKFTVESNLQIIRQQDEIIRLLEKIAATGGK